MNRPNILVLSFLLIATISVVAFAQSNCVYTFKIKTGTREDAGTDAVIGVVISNKSGQFIEIKNLERWGGKMGSGHDYYEKGNVDVFGGKGRCLSSSVCLLTLNSDGSGHKPGWYVDYVEVTTAKPGTASKVLRFSVKQWLATSEPPFQLSTQRNKCAGRVGSEIRKSLYSII